MPPIETDRRMHQGSEQVGDVVRAQGHHREEGLPATERQTKRKSMNTVRCHTMIGKESDM